MPLERVQVDRPEAAEWGEPGIDLHQRLRSDPIQASLRVYARLNEAGLAKNPQMLRHRGLRYSQLLFEIAYRTLGGGEEAEDRAATRFGNDGERRFHGLI